MVKKKKIAILKRSTIKKPKYKSDVEPGFISHQFWKDWVGLSFPKTTDPLPKASGQTAKVSSWAIPQALLQRPPPPSLLEA